MEPIAAPVAAVAPAAPAAPAGPLPQQGAVPSTATRPAAALAGVSTVGAGGTALTKKIQKALTQRYDSQSHRDALKSLSGFFEENTVHSRRNLRSTIEGQNLVLHQEFVHSFGNLEKQLENLERFVDVLDSACQKAASELHKSKADTQSVLERASSLRKESQAIDEKQEVLAKFLEKFRLSEADTQIMKSGDRPIDDDFFKAFEKLETVRANARQMLTACGQQTSGVDILHETSEILEACYERMFVWVRQQCHTSAGGAVRSSSHELDSPTGAALKRALSMLVERPVYFNHCVKDVAKVRKQSIVQRFFEALSQGDSAGNRPIELQAYDPVRYVGDMLAWIHENAASEREAIAALMGKARSKSSAYAEENAAHDEAPVASSSSSVEPGFEIVNFDDILDQTLEGLVDAFAGRTAQVLETTTSIVAMYKVAQVFSFFAKTLEDVLKRRESCLVEMCNHLHDRTQQSFLDLWDAQSVRLRQGATGVYVSELSAPPFVTESVNTLTEILTIYETALVPEDEREEDFHPILSAAFDPLLNHCQQVASMMDKAEGQVFIINCVSVMQTPLRKHAFTVQRVAMYADLLDDQMQLLVEGQSHTVLTKLGLAECLKALRAKPPDAPLSSVAELHPVSLSTTLRSFYNSLFTMGGALALPMLERIPSRNLRSEARAGVAQQIAAAYEELYKGVAELDVATHTPEQVRTLLE